MADRDEEAELGLMYGSDLADSADSSSFLQNMRNLLSTCNCILQLRNTTCHRPERRQQWWILSFCLTVMNANATSCAHLTCNMLQTNAIIMRAVFCNPRCFLEWHYWAPCSKKAHGTTSWTECASSCLEPSTAVRPYVRHLQCS